MKAFWLQLVMCVLLLAAIVMDTACAGKKISTVVGQTGLAVAQAIGQLQETTKQLTENGTIPPAAALTIQEKLLALNEKAKPLPELLREIDRLEQATGSATAPIDQAIAILQVLGNDLTVVVAGVPVSDTAKALLDAVVSTQKVVQATLIEIAKLKGAQS